MQLITVHVPEAYLSALDTLINEKIYPNRSEAIRVAIRDMLKTELTMFIQPGQKMKATA